MFAKIRFSQNDTFQTYIMSACERQRKCSYNYFKLYTKYCYCNTRLKATELLKT